MKQRALYCTQVISPRRPLLGKGQRGLEQQAAAAEQPRKHADLSLKPTTTTVAEPVAGLSECCPPACTVSQERQSQSVAPAAQERLKPTYSYDGGTYCDLTCENKIGPPHKNTACSEKGHVCSSEPKPGVKSQAMFSSPIKNQSPSHIPFVNTCHVLL